ncbi:adenylyltransferase/cytidyltransferase family protein [Actinoplanes sp. NPDC051851]|uniref:adenylyltransferase/cytidyltransferase family protein n=1 Tax=Actinoplanes sp. NPDC051851 TaxID=3154753 RepID=UPI003419B11A
MGGAVGRYAILSGRFQPFHKGHFQVVMRAADLVRADMLLVIGVVASTGNRAESQDAGFSATADEHHAPDRNLWPAAVRLEAVTRVSRLVVADRPLVRCVPLVLPRPDLAWDWIIEWFPGERTWIIPDAGEEFDDWKATFFLEQGDQVLRVPEDSHVDGRTLRRLYIDRDEHFVDGVPAEVADLYWEHIGTGS